MTAVHRVAAAAAVAALAFPAAASGHAWSDTRTLSTAASSLGFADMSASGHGIAGWSQADGAWVAIAAPGGGFGAPVKLADNAAQVEDVAIAENGDAFAAWQNQNGLNVAIRKAGETWSGWEQLVGVGEYDAWDLAAGPDGQATVVASAGGDPAVFRRETGETAFGPGAVTDGATFYHLQAGYVGDVVTVAGNDYSNQHGATIDEAGTLSSFDPLDGPTGSPAGVRLETQRAGHGAILTWPAGGHMYAARAGADGVLGDGQRVTSSSLYKGVMFPDGGVSPTGGFLVGWGDAEFDPVSLAGASSPTAAFAPVTAPTVPGNRTDDIQVAFDSRGAAQAGWYFSDNANNGITGRIEVATRLPGSGAWCGAETLASHRANGYTLRLRFDGAGRGFALWQTPAGGPTGTASIWVSRYEARGDCPPTPPAPPPEEVQREEVVYLPPPPGPPVVTTVVRVVRLTLPPRAAVDRRGRVRIPVRCTGTEATCTGRLALKRGRAVWGSRSFTMAKGQRVLRVQLRRSARRALAKRRRANVTAELRLRQQPVKRSRLALSRR